MSNQDVWNALKELEEVRPEKLNDKAKRLFEAIMKIADSRDKAEADLYEANNRIVDLMNIIDERDKMIDLMARDLKTPVNSKEWIIEYYKKRCENAKD